MIKSHQQSGFTAVELLITLFVAAAFLVTGYQLYSIIIKDSGQTRAQERASNVAYDYLRRYSTNALNPCNPITPLNSVPITVSGITSATATVTISCPYSSSATISKIDVVILYNTPQQKVEYATYVNQ